MKRLVLVLSAALLAACAPGLRGPSAAGNVTAAGLLRLEDRREYDPAYLEAAFAHGSPDIRRRAAHAAANLRDARAIPALGRLLSDADTSVAAQAAFALGQIADSAAVPLLVPVVTPARIAAAPTVVGEAAYALGKIRHPQARAALERLLADAPRDGAGNRDAIGMALLAVWRQGRPTPVDAVRPWLSSADAEIRWRAAYALARRAEPAATAALWPHRADAEPLVRSFAARVLTGPMADSSGIGRGPVQDALVRTVTSDPSQIVRINAIRSLGTYPGARSLAVLSDIIAGRRHSYEQIVAIEALQRLGKDASASGTLLGQVARDTSRDVFIRQTAIAALLDVDEDEALRLLPHIENSGDWRLRAAAARVYGQASPRSRRHLLNVVNDPDGRVASAGVEQALTALGDTVGEIRDVLVSAIGTNGPRTGPGSRDVMLRTNALNGLAKLADPATLPALFEAYQYAQGDSLNDAALAAVDAIGAVAKKDPTAAERFFGRFQRSSDYLVRQRVRTAFGDTVGGAWGAPLPIETGRSMAEYERAIRQSARNPRAVIVTNRGEIEVELFAGDAPLTVRSFLDLAGRGFFDGQEWPRVVPNFVIQGGDPRGDTSGGPGYAIRDEINRHLYQRGTLGVALSGPDTGGSQWFITHSPQPHLDGTYTVFGRVVRGMDVADQVLPGDRIIRIREVR